MKTKKVPVIVQEEENEVPVEVLASEIKAISVGVKTLLKGRLNKKAIYLLIQHAAPYAGATKYSKQRVGLSEIKAVIEGIENLESEYLK